ncbi:MAG TPA: class I SAM-dependent methyltransferase [Beijerinckiaceae bacterium]|nr:class I SAM-dependent methyltransferase [Beijerinckiaceae bacterium]
MTAAHPDARFWDRFARRYAAASIRDTAGYERTLARTSELIRGMASVLEIGCGTGTTALRMAGGVQHLLATDIAPQMIAIAREKVAAQGCSNVAFEVAAPDAITAPDGGFDAILAFNVLHLLRDDAATLAHLHTLLKPGGLLISKTPCLVELNLFIRLAIPVMRRIGLAPYVRVQDAATLESRIAAAGFTIIEQARHGSTGKDFRTFLVARRPA